MKNTKQTIVAIALSSLTLSAYAGGLYGNPEHNVIDESFGTSIVTASVNDGWKEVTVERTQFVGPRNAVAPSGGYAYSKEEMLQARMDYRESSN